MKKIYYLTAGHQVINGKGTGAISPLGDEAVQAERLRDAVANIMISRGHEVRTECSKDKLGAVISWLVGRVDGDDVVVDFHFNAAAIEKANGTEVIIPQKYTQSELKLAVDMTTAISNTLGTVRRKGKLIYHGVKTEDETQHRTIGILRRPYKAKNILIEVCFISNEKDMTSYYKNFDKLAMAIANVLDNN